MLPDAIEATSVVFIAADEAICVMDTQVIVGEQVISSCEDGGTALAAAHTLFPVSSYDSICARFACLCLSCSWCCCVFFCFLVCAVSYPARNFCILYAS